MEERKCSVFGCNFQFIRNKTFQLCRRHNEERLGSIKELSVGVYGCVRLCEDCSRIVSTDKTSKCRSCYFNSKITYKACNDRPSWGGCHDWIGAINNKRTPTVTKEGKTLSVRRVIWECLVGEISAGLVVRTNCENPKCIWIGHLSLATHRIGAIYNPGDRFCDESGYVFIVQPEGRSISEHIMIMEEYLERPLEPGENVHHLNGIKNDNRIENLELWLVHQPKGQRVRDIVSWAWEIIDRYDKEVEEKRL